MTMTIDKTTSLNSKSIVIYVLSHKHRKGRLRGLEPLQYYFLGGKGTSPHPQYLGSNTVVSLIRGIIVTKYLIPS